MFKPKLINRPDGQEDGLQTVQTLQDLWDKAASLGAIRVWQAGGRMFAGRHMPYEVKIMFLSPRGSEIEAVSGNHASINDALISAIEEAWSLGARP